MTRDDVDELLMQISMVDDRVLRTDDAEIEAQATMWAAALIDVPLGFAGEAVGRHYAEHPWPVKPSDITARWRAEARTRMAHHVETVEPSVDPDRAVDYVQALRAGRAAVVGGECEPMAVGALEQGSGPDLVPANPGFLAAKRVLYPPRFPQPPEFAVRCSWCGASPKQRCKTTHRGRPMNDTHPSRKEAFAAAQQRAASA